MKNKLIYSGIIAVIFIAAMIIYKDSLTLEALILVFVGAGGSIVAVWQWLNAKEDVKALKTMNRIATARNERLLEELKELR